MAEIDTGQTKDIQSEVTQDFPHLKKIKRRTMLAWLGAGVTSLALHNIVSGKETKDTQVSISDRLRDKQIKDEANEVAEGERMIQHFSFYLYVDRDNFPVAYKLESAEKIYFTEEQKQALLNAKNEARLRKSMIPALQFVRNLAPTEYGQSVERPYITDEPEDLMSKETLSRNGITLVNEENNEQASKIFLREAAVNESGILEPLALLNEGKVDEDKFHLHIVNLNDTFIGKGIASAESQYDPYRPFFEDIASKAENHRQAMIEQYSRSISDLEQQLQLHPENLGIKEKIRTRKIYKLMFSKTLNTNDMMDEYIWNGYATAGEYATPTFGDRSPLVRRLFGENTGIVFITSPKLSDTVQKDIYSVCFDENAEVEVQSDPWLPARSQRGPRITDSYQSPEDYTLLPEDADYLVNPDKWGHTTYHEIMHALTFDVFPRLAAENRLQQSSLFQFFMSRPNIAEFLHADGTIDFTNNKIQEGIADLGALSILDRAHTVWEESGYTDNSGYALVAKIPEQMNQPAGYQITESQAPQVLPIDQAA